ncbi:MAG TPA: hypothetical protein VIP70_07045 [Nitrososphaeraceae archaeon]
MTNFEKNIKMKPVVGFLLISLGVLLTAIAGSWDITNHLLNKPETFFSPPHSALYTGVAIVIIGSIITYRYHIFDINNKKASNQHYYNNNSNSNNKTNLYSIINKLNDLPLSIKLVLIGVIMLVSAGPFDFAWHSAFGLDGLLSPPHSVLTAGMALSSIGALLGIIVSCNKVTNFNDNNSRNKKKRNEFDSYTTNNSPPSSSSSSSSSYSYSSSSPSSPSSSNSTNADDSISHAVATISPIFIVIGILPVWITISGIVDMASLPFSDTQYFNFNPDPTLGAIIATICFPFVVSFMLFSSFKLSSNNNSINIAEAAERRRTITTTTTTTKKVTKQRKMTFGILSINGAGFIVINLATAILPNEYLIPTIPFYLLNIIPIMAMDALLSKFSRSHNNSNNNKEIANYIAGAILGLIFFMLYYPLITHTYNEALPNPQPVWPSLTSLIYFNMIGQLFPLIIAPAIIAGILGVIVSSKVFTQKPAPELVASKPI